MSSAIAVYCGSSVGKHKAHADAALSVGRALAEKRYDLVYGGGSSGLMGIVSNAVLEVGGDVTGIVPFPIYASGGERSKTFDTVDTNGHIPQRGKIRTIIVDSMHERKVEMAKRSVGFIGLPGGFGTFEEIMEVTTWTQLGIHHKPVVLLNVLSYFEPLRQLIENGTTEGYINPSSNNIIIFVDGPSSHEDHEDFDWGTAAVEAIETWPGLTTKSLYDWGRRRDGMQGHLDIT